MQIGYLIRREFQAFTVPVVTMNQGILQNKNHFLKINHAID